MKYTLTADVTISVYTEVEADSLEQAIEIAEFRDIEHYEFRNEAQKSYAWISEEIDGLPQNIREQ